MNGRDEVWARERMGEWKRERAKDRESQYVEEPASVKARGEPLKTRPSFIG